MLELLRLKEKAEKQRLRAVNAGTAAEVLEAPEGVYLAHATCPSFAKHLGAQLTADRMRRSARAMEISLSPPAHLG